MTKSSQLAVLGGDPLIPAGTMKKWPPIDDADRKLVLHSLNGDVHTYGPNCLAFEKEFAQWSGHQHAIFTNSGTAALHMAVVACGVGVGDHVLVTAYSWSSSATCIVHHNAIPIFVDIDFDTINMDPAQIEAAITPRTKAIIAVHLHGLGLAMPKIMAIARKHNLKVIEDCCQAHGATVDGRKVGTFGDCAAFSFNQNKCLCAGEGGMFVTNDQETRNLAAQLWSFGETRTPAESRDYHAYALGWMYRSTDMTAAFGRAQLAKLDGYIQTQQTNAAALEKEIAAIPGVIAPIVPANHGHTYYNYTIRFDMAKIGWGGDPCAMRDCILKAVQAEGAAVGIWQAFILPRMTVFQAKNAYGDGFPWSYKDAGKDVDYNPENFPVAQRHADTHFGMTMPLRAPNGPELGQKTGLAIRKVFDNLNKLDPAEINKA